MTEERLPLAELLAKAGDGDFLRGVAEAVAQLLMETDVDGLIGAGRHERSGDRTTYRNHPVCRRAIVACMRRLLGILNAIIRTKTPWQNA